ncbi:MAG: sigma-70 family RNA polymerase sigma factor [Chloroflexota bacterium]|nr:sigma-70 family RNA polymerase sigma factor [Chloroflexota bacterium]
MGTRQSLDPNWMQQNLGGDLPRSLDEHSDEFLLHTLASGASWAMDPLYHRYSNLLYALAYRMVTDRQVAEDLIQETFLAIWLRAISYSPQEGTVRSWLLALVHHRAIDYLRRVRRQTCWQEIPWQDVTHENDVAVPDVWEEVWASVQQVQVREALLLLPREQRLVILLVYFRGWTHMQVAQRYQLPCGTVKSRIRLGLLHLKRALEQQGAGEFAGGGKGRTPDRHTVQPPRAIVVVQVREHNCPSGYELCRDGACTCFGYTEWLPLLEQLDAFEFSGSEGNFSARKVKRAHDRTYWYAFRRGSAEKKTYLGKSTEVTLPRLEAMARTLHEGKPST